MHIMEGYLPAHHALGWSLAAAVPLALGVRKMSKSVRERPSARLLLGACAGFAFVISSLKLPSLTGSCSHPTGIALGAVLLGPSTMAVVGAAVLVFQALLLAHGGLTTLGANAFSMAIVGGAVAWGTHRLARAARASDAVALFLSAFLANLATYATTAAQLGWAFPAADGGVAASTAKFAAVFLPTQLPLSVSEGLLTVLVMNLLRGHLGDSLSPLLAKGEA